jgi:glutamyl-tRNA synthetase
LTQPEDLKQLARKIALLNAVKHEGKADAGAVTGRILGQRQDLKANARDVMKIVTEVVKEVNEYTVNEQRSMIEENWPELLAEERIKEEKILPPLPNADKYRIVVTRFSPNPDCVLHLGSIRAIILSHDYARMYKGKFILRFEDTDPRLKKSVLEYYDLIREDIRWLGCEWNQEFVQSDRIPIYYEHAEKLLEIGGAYVCTCKKEDFSEKVLAARPCPCRDLPVDENLARWKRMLNGTFNEGDAIVRVKTDLTHPNPAVRDWPALRIIDTEKSPHPRVGSRYRVWPLYNFACGVDDHLTGITHIIRGKEHVTNTVRQRYMYSHLGWSYPEATHYGRLKIAGAALSKSKIIKALAEGLVKDFSDPRLGTLIALRRRGITPEALRKIVIEVGPRPVDATLSWDNIYAQNRKIVDPRANRYFYVEDPVPISVSGVSRTYTSKPLLHPSYPERGNRKLEVEPINNEAHLLISKKDFASLRKGRVVRFMELFNVTVEKIMKDRVQASFHSEPYDEAKKLNASLIHWLPQVGNLRVNVLMPTAEISEGVGEQGLKQEAKHQIVQLTRFGFGRIDEVTLDLVKIYYAHN